MSSTEEMVKQEPLDEEQCWSMVITRRKAADGLFVFAVRSTGIYCRPSCPARHARREQVTFFRLQEEAVKAGFRACRRCHPDQVDLPDSQTVLVEQICSYLEAHLDAPLHLADLSQQFHLSPYYLQRTFKRIKGISPRQYAEICRLQQFKKLLQEGDSVTGALYDAGYQSSSSVYERASVQLGMTPTAYRKGGKGTHIAYSIVKNELGYVLVGVTERGVAAVRFGDSEHELAADLAREYPEAELSRDEERLQPWVKLLIQSMQEGLTNQAVPLDVTASAFRWKVWQCLRAIPRGETRSYGEIALAIGQPTAARAVAQACANNPVAVLIPCHRVVRNDGGLGGYRWGVRRKEQLLALERAIPATIPE